MCAMSKRESESAIGSGESSCRYLERHWPDVIADDPAVTLAPDVVAHLASCMRCQAQRQSFQRLGVTLAATPRGRTPRPGWDARVLGQLARRDRARPRPRLLWAGALSLALAAATGFVLFTRPAPPQSPWSVPFEVEVLAGQAENFRAGPRQEGGLPAAAVAPGDRLSIRFAVQGSAHADVRVFRARELVFTCAHSTACQRQGDKLEVLVPLSLAGRYEALLVWSRAPLPEPAPGAAEDAARLLAAGARVQALDPILVR
jgi:hypothetical protein